MRTHFTITVIITLALGLASGAFPALAASPDELELLLLGDTDSSELLELVRRHDSSRLPADDAQRALGRLAGVDALLVDLSRVDASSRAPVDAVVDVAHRRGIAVVAAHAASADVSRWVGLGVDAELIVLGLTPDGLSPTLEIVAAAGADLKLTTDALVGTRADRIEQLIESNSSAGSLKTSGQQRINYKAWFLGGEVLYWTPSGNPGGSDQIASMNISYQVELVANSEYNMSPNARYLKIKTQGNGMNPGNLPPTSDQDADRERGWYQEKLRIDMEPDQVPGLALIAFAPQTTNTNSTYSLTTGWEVGFDTGGEWGMSYGQSQTSTSTFENFRVDYSGVGQAATWDYKMASTGGTPAHPYSEPGDLIYENIFTCPLFTTCLREVNEMAVGTIGLTAEAVWRADLDFDATVSFDMGHSQRLAFIRHDHTTCQLLVCTDYYETFYDSDFQGFDLDVDFSQVHPYGPDADDDGIPDYFEGTGDPDNDGLDNSHDTDSDGDGLPDAAEWIDDPDDDGLDNYLDTDSDADSFLDSQEAAAGTDPYSAFSRPDVAMAGIALGRATTGDGGTTVAMPSGMTDPIVLVGPATEDDAEPGVLRIDSVGPTQFSARFQEWPSEDGLHPDETFSWLALERGRWGTATNSVWEADRATVTGTGNWTQVTFTAPMTEVPVVLVSLQTDTAGQALAARVRNVTVDGFEVALFAEQAAAPVTATETVAYLAANSRWGWDRVNIDGADVPMLEQRFLADHRQTQVLSSFVRLAEETSGDPETDHTLEDLAVIAFGTEIFAQDQDAADLDPVAVVWDPPRYGAGIEVGLVRGVTRTPGLIVPYARSFTEPIVVAYPDDPADNDLGAVRARTVHRTPNLQRYQIEGGFLMHFQLFPPDTPNWFDECYNYPDPPRDIRYVVAERGNGEVGGLLWQAGSVYSDRYAGNGQWESLFFQAGFAQPPSVFSDLQNERCGDIIGAAHQNVSATGLDVANDYLSLDCAYCTLVFDPEEDWYEVGFLAIQPGVGATIDQRLLQVTADTVEIVYGSSAPEPPTARFTWSPINPQPGETVQFTDTSTGVVSQWSWDFGDGGTSTEQHPTHVFASPGTYVVLHAASSNLGLDTTTRAVVVGGSQAGIFADGFESAGTDAWSTTTP